MKKTLLLTALCLFLVPATTFAYNVALNDAGFEANYANPGMDPGFDWTLGWGGFGWGDTGTSYTADGNNTAPVRSGIQSLMMTMSAPAGAAWINEAYTAVQSQPLVGADGQLLNYKAYINITSEKDGKAYLGVKFLDAGGTALGSLETTGIDYVTGGWVPHTLSTVIPTGTAKAEFTLIAYGGSWASANNITAYFDDVTAEVIPEPASMLLLGSGLVGLLGFTRRRK